MMMMRLLKSLSSLSSKASSNALGLGSTILFAAFLVSPTADACPGADRVWNGTTNNSWSNGANWTPADSPNTGGEDAIIQSAQRPARVNQNITVGCVQVVSGTLRCRAGRTLTIQGSEFTATSQNSLDRCDTTTGAFDMNGAAAQDLNIVDNINNLTISNNTTVTSLGDFSVLVNFTLSGTTTTFRIQNNFTLGAGVTLTIPAGVTVIVENGATLTAGGDVTVNGTLDIEPGSTLKMPNGSTLSVNGGGAINLNGASGNIATVTSTGAGNTYGFNVAGDIEADYFRIDRMTAPGVNVTGSIVDIDNGEFHYPPVGGYGITLGAAVTVPGTWDSIGFFNDDSNAGVQNINATAYNNPGGVYIDNWLGDVGGEANDADANNSIDWGTEANTLLTLADNTAGGSPPATLNQSSGPELFATFAFALTKTDTPTDVTNATFTMNGTAASSDVEFVRIYVDNGAGNNCQYDVGVDDQVGGDLSLSGSPPTVTTAFAGGDITVSDTNIRCVHVIAGTTATAQDAKTISFQIAQTSHVTIDQAYNFSPTAGPPVGAGTTTIIGDLVRKWEGSQTVNWDRRQNWRANQVPTTTTDCQVGPGIRDTLLNITPGDCQNAELPAGGVLDFGGTTNELAIYGTLAVANSYSFNNAANGNIAMRGANNQSLEILTQFPGNVSIINTGTAPNDKVTLSDDVSIGGNLTVTSGELVVSTGMTLTVLGNINVGAGGTLTINPGATLELGNGSTVTIDGTLAIVGTGANPAVMTSTSAVNAYNVIVNGTINARYYTFARLNTAGVSIENAATINAINHMQDGTFTYPVNNSTTLLQLKRQVPGGTLDDMNFTLGGSGATGTVNIDTTGAAAGTLNLNDYTGDLGGAGFDNDPTYNLNWVSPANTIDLTQEATTPGTLDTGSTYNVGRFGFQQTLAGASYMDADITSLKLTLTGTGSANDIDQVRIYYDSACSGSGGSLIGSGTLSGNPASRTFAIGAGQATVQADVATPPMRCIYVEYDIASNATNGDTLGVEIAGSTDVVNDQAYAIAAGTPTPVNLGTPGTINQTATNTRWTGTMGTDWHTPGNWDQGVPTSAINCEIVSRPNTPIITGAAGICADVTITSGTLSLAAGGDSLEVYGDFDNNDTFIPNGGSLIIRDDGVTPTDQTVSSVSTLDLSFNKTAGGSVRPSGALTLSPFAIPGGQNFQFLITSTNSVRLPAGGSMASGLMVLQQNATLRIANGQTMTVSGGTFRTSGINDAYPQSTSTKALITNNGSGRYGFVANGGTLDLTGFEFRFLDVNGLRIQGSASLSSFNGGQFTELLADFATPVRAMQINTSGSVPASANNIGFMWDDANSYRDEAGWCGCGPSEVQSYFLVHATSCSGGGPMTFNQWFGDFFVDNGIPNTEDKIYDTDDGGSCQINMTAAASPVDLLSFNATGYNDAVGLDWETAAEWDHLGFNVYRSTEPASGFTQINDELVRNDMSNTTAHGHYYFSDNNVDNGTTYYYYIEDVATNGTRTWHGPQAATPDAAAPADPGPDSGDHSGESGNNGDSGNDPSAGPIANPDLIDLGNGVHILRKTAHAFQMQVIPPSSGSPYSPSPLNPAFEQLNLPGYSKMTEPGHPELLERIVLVEVDEARTSASLESSDAPEGAIETHAIIPAPRWEPGPSGNLEAQYYLDADAYSNTDYSPTDFVSVDPDIVTIAGRKFARVRIYPYLYKSATNEVRHFTSLTFEVGLDGESLGTPPAAMMPDISPAAHAGTARLRYQESGFYRITYDELESHYLTSAFEGIDPANYRMYYRGNEVAMLVDDGNGTFDSGDSITYYVLHDPGLEDTEDEIVLSPWALYGETDPPLRFGNLDGDPSGLDPTTQTGTFRSTHMENDWNPIFDRPLGNEIDHLYWQRIFVEEGTDFATAPGYTTMTITANLAGLDNDADQDVLVMVELASRGANSVNPLLHLGVTVNGYPGLVDSQTFLGGGPMFLFFRAPAHHFFWGPNEIRLHALGDTLPPGDWGLIDIDSVRVDYWSSFSAHEDVASVYNRETGKTLTIDEFSTDNIDVYDVSIIEEPMIIDNATTAVLTDYSTVTFAAFDDASEERSYHYVALEENAYKSPSSMRIGAGGSYWIRDPSNDGELLVIGREDLTDAAWELTTARENSGLSVVVATLEQIYAEFSHGRVSSFAIRDAIDYALDSWSTKPKYVLFLGNGTYDPKDGLAYGTGNVTPFPIPMTLGEFGDFGHDLWFVAEPGQTHGRVPVGRIPARSAWEMAAYATKLLDYEAGETAPTEDGSRQMFFVADNDTLGENFAMHTSSLSDTALTTRSSLSTQTLQRSQMADDSAYQDELLDMFDQGPMFISYLGHGAEDRWATGVFELAQADSLSNNRLPIVVALSCLNGYFYEPDPSFRSLAEAMVMNPNGGAVAFIGSTTTTAPNAQMNFAHALMRRYGEETRQPGNEARLGDIFAAAKNMMNANASNSDAHRSFTLMGDPSSPILAHFFDAEPPPPVQVTPTPAPVETPAVAGPEVVVEPEPVLEETEELAATVPAAPEPEKKKKKNALQRALGCGVAAIANGGDTNSSTITLLFLLMLFAPLVITSPTAAFARLRAKTPRRRRITPPNRPPE